jgi:hypothetical protein
VHTFQNTAVPSGSKMMTVMRGAPCSQDLFYQPFIVMQMDENSFIIEITPSTVSA